MQNKESSDTHELIDRIRSGDQRAFQRFIKMYQRLVGHIVFRLVTNTSDREDLCQDVFIKAYQNLKGFRYQCKISTWIAKIAYNTCLNHLQKKRPVLYNDYGSESRTLDGLMGGEQSPDSATIEKDTISRLHRELRDLPVQYRTIITLYHLDEMSYNEIGQIMNLPEGTVKSYLFRARKQLRERLVSKYKVEELWEAAI